MTLYSELMRSRCDLSLQMSGNSGGIEFGAHPSCHGVFPGYCAEDPGTHCWLSSFQVSLGIHLKNENKTDEMAEIMEHLQQCVPSKRATESFVMSGSEPVTLQMDHFHAAHPFWR